jgi:hypothetical protein
VKRMNVFFFCAGLWILALFGGFFALLKYEGTPGAATASPSEWPRETKVSRTPGNFTLIMAAHPRCPCTRVSIDELRRVLERNSTPVDIRVLFFKPLGSDWTPTDLWRQAVAIPGVQAIWDDDGIEAARFGAHTSGHALLFDPAGKLLFSGGVTSGRGHSGPSKGNLSLAAWLTAGEAAAGEALVFGCTLTDPQSSCTKGTKACQLPQ